MRGFLCHSPEGTHLLSGRSHLVFLAPTLNAMAVKCGGTHLSLDIRKPGLYSESEASLSSIKGDSVVTERGLFTSRPP